MFHKRFLTLVLTIIAISSGNLTTANTANSGEITVTKSPRQENPGVFISSFNGTNEMKVRLRHVLLFSGWLTPVENANDADYQMGVVVATGEQTKISISLTNQAGRTLTISASGKDYRETLLTAIDALIQQIAGVPGPCRAPIVFVQEHNGVKEICMMTIFITDHKQLSFNGTTSTEPRWQPNAPVLTYTLYRNSAAETIQLDLTANRQRRLAQTRGLNAGAALSPRGNSYAVCRTSDGKQVDLQIIDIETGNITKITNDRAVEASPTWSPNGNQVCFISDSGGKPQLHLADIQTKRTKRLILNEAASPSWSPDGKKIAFSTRVNGVSQLAYIELETGKVEIFTDNTHQGHWESPSWSPDSRHVVATLENRYQRRLAVVDSWYGTVNFLTQPGPYSLPDWSKVPVNFH